MTDPPRAHDYPASRDPALPTDPGGEKPLNLTEKPDGGTPPPAQTEPASPTSEVAASGSAAQVLLQEMREGKPVLSAEEMLEELKPQEKRVLETMQGIEQKLLRKLGA